MNIRITQDANGEASGFNMTSPITTPDCAAQFGNDHALWTCIRLGILQEASLLPEDAEPFVQLALHGPDATIRNACAALVKAGETCANVCLRYLDHLPHCELCKDRERRFGIQR